VEGFSKAFCECVSVLSSNDPFGNDCVKKSYIKERGWHFEFNRTPIFITTFAPFYPKTNARYSFDADNESAFILLQPEYSFAWHNLEPDSPHTQWDNPQKMRLFIYN
jgi:hypothetical protein